LDIENIFLFLPHKPKLLKYKIMVNKVFLIGNVGKDPEVRYVENNIPVAKFSLATSESYKNKSGEKVTTTEWHNIVVWRGLAEVAEKYVKKGTPLFIEGKIRSRSWDDKDGNKHYMTEIVADSMKLLGRKEGTNGSPSSEVTADVSAPEADAIVEETDDLPF
jgi:single-strand DNA-binding protein